MKAPALLRNLARNGAHTDERTGSAAHRDGPGPDYYDGVVVAASAIGERATQHEVYDRARAIIDRLGSDDYVTYVREFVDRGRERAGSEWRFADITTVLYAAAEALRPTSYLEIGVRRGRSMSVVASMAPECDIVGVDMWVDDYAGISNPGPDHVREEMRKLGHTGRLDLLSGNSHRVVPQLFRERRELSFDLVTVDGDHSPRGARADIREVLPRLRIGGVLVFDDIRHRHHPRLGEVWRSSVAADPRYVTWEFDDVGFGVALAVRRW